MTDSRSGPFPSSKRILKIELLSLKRMEALEVWLKWYKDVEGLWEVIGSSLDGYKFIYHVINRRSFTT